MIKIKGVYTEKNNFTVEIPVNSFEDICFYKMSRDNSDEIIKNAIIEKYGIVPDEIIVEKEIEE